MGAGKPNGVVARLWMLHMQSGHVHHRALLADKSAPTDGRIILLVCMIVPWCASASQPRDRQRQTVSRIVWSQRGDGDRL